MGIGYMYSRVHRRIAIGFKNAPFTRAAVKQQPLTPPSRSAMPLTTGSVYPPPSGEFMKWPSRRSVVHSTKGIVACTQPLAAKCGIDILNAGGNAAVSGPESGCKSYTNRGTHTGRGGGSGYDTAPPL